MSITRTQVVEFLTNQATNADLDVVFGAARARRAALATIEAAAIEVGAAVETRTMSPKYLSGLVGEVIRIRSVKGKTFARVRLDEASSVRLASNPGAKRYAIPDPQTGCLEVEVPCEGLKLSGPADA